MRPVNRLGNGLGRHFSWRRAVEGTFALLTLAVPGLGVATAQQSTDVVQQLRQASSEAEMDRAVDQFVRDEIDMVQELEHLLRESDRLEIKARACYLLGELRGQRAGQALVENLLLTEAMEDDGEGRLLQRHPCQEALVKIGKPTEYLLIKVLSDSESEDLKAGALKVLQEIEGWRGAVFVLEEARVRAEGGEQRELEKALEQAKREVP